MSLEGDRSDLVQENTTAIGDLEKAFLGADRTGKSTFYVAEEVALQQVRGKAPGVDRHERLRFPRAVIVDRLRNELFPGPAFASNQYRALRRGHLSDERVNSLHARRLADENVEALPVAQSRFQRTVLVDEAPLLHAVRHNEAHFVVLERLRHVVESTPLHRFDGGLDRGESGDHDRDELGVHALELIQNVDSGLIGKHDVDDGQVDRLTRRHGDTVLARRRELDAIALRREKRFENLPHHLLVVDDENGSFFSHTNLLWRDSFASPRRCNTSRLENSDTFALLTARRSEVARRQRVCWARCMVLSSSAASEAFMRRTRKLVPLPSELSTLM